MPQQTTADRPLHKNGSPQRRLIDARSVPDPRHADATRQIDETDPPASKHNNHPTFHDSWKARAGDSKRHEVSVFVASNSEIDSRNKKGQPKPTFFLFLVPKRGTSNVQQRLARRKSVRASLTDPLDESRWAFVDLSTRVAFLRKFHAQLDKFEQISKP